MKTYRTPIGACNGARFYARTYKRDVAVVRVESGPDAGYWRLMPLTDAQRAGAIIVASIAAG